VPSPAEEPVDPSPLLRKQLILAQAQILELEDVRDELQSTIEQRTRILTELQTLADHVLAETRQAAGSENPARETLESLVNQRGELQVKLDAVQRDLDLFRSQLEEARKISASATSALAARDARIAALESEVRALKLSQTSPSKLRQWLSRLFG
jgi:chromosome segregation ATPase